MGRLSEVINVLMKRTALLALMMILLCSAALAQSAVVDNGGDPASRLNMRAEPDKGASSLGKFYSGTPVEILSDAGGGWSHVRIGDGANSITGYMMSSYLRASSAVNACQRRQVTSPYGTPVVVLRSRPSNSYDAVTMLPVGETVTVIGVSGDFCYVLTQGGTVGCLLSGELK